MTRPPAFRLPPTNPVPLFLFFGHGDYVIARDAAEASVFWMDHFGEISEEGEFEKIPGDQVIELYLLEIDYGDFEVATREQISDGTQPDTWPAHFLIDQFGPGYLASTTED